MNTPSTYGFWNELPDNATQHHHMNLDASQLASYWRRCSLSSDFWSRYMALGVASKPQAGALSRDDVESVLSYLLNELFENCAKFSAGPTLGVEYNSWCFADHISYQFRNHIRPESVDAFAALITEILESDPDVLYFEKLEYNAETNAGGSGLGYLTLIKDYGVRFGFRFTQVSSDSVAVDVQAHVSLNEKGF